MEYRVDTDVITAIRLRTGGRLTPDNPATVTFHIMGRSYTVRNIVIPANDSQLVWVKWHTPETPQTITITVSLSRGFTAQDTFVAKIVDLNEKDTARSPGNRREPRLFRSRTPLQSPEAQCELGCVELLLGPGLAMV